MTILSDPKVILSIVVLILNILVFCLYFIVAKIKFGKIKSVGTIHVDSTRESKDIVLFTLDMPIVDLEKERVVLMKVDKANLKEWDKSY